MWPILFRIGDYPVHSYGLMLAVAVVVGLLTAEWAARQRGINPDFVLDLTLVLVIAGIVGSRLAYVAIEWPLFANDLWSIIRIWDGGLSYYGALAAGLPFVFLLSRRHNVRFGKVADPVALGLAAGYPFARIGCFLNGCCYGKPTDLPWAVTFPYDVVARHPTQLYSMVIGILIFVMLWYTGKHQKFPGQLALLYLFLYGIYRFAIDFLRVSPPAGAYLTLGQTASLLVAGIALVILLVRFHELNKQP